MVLNRNFIRLLIPLGLLAILIFLIKSPLVGRGWAVTFALTADLLFTIPLIYFLLIRKTRIPKTTVVPVMVIGILVGSYFLPKESQVYLDLFKYWILPVIELGILTFVLFKIRKAIHTFKNIKSETPDFYVSLKSVCAEILPEKLVLPLATELAVLYYGFINWKKRPLNSNEFSYHKKSGTPALFYAFILIIATETVALHILLSHWSVVASWILTALSIYTAIQVFGFAKALSQRPISIHDDRLCLKYGILNEVEISFSDIEKIELSRKSPEKNQATRTLSPLGEVESHNVIISLSKEHQLTGLYGIKQKVRILMFFVDEPLAFKEKMDKILHKIL